MNPFLVTQLVQIFGDRAALCARQIWLTSLQAAAIIPVIWLLCRLLPRLSATTRHWLWRLVYCKLWISLFWVTPFALPLLASAPPKPAQIKPQPPIRPTNKELEDFAVRLTRDNIELSRPTLPAMPNPIAAHMAATYLPGVPTPQAIGFFPIAIGTLWATGVLCCLGALLRQVFSLRRLCRRARPLEGADIASLANELSKQMGMRRRPCVYASHEANAPLITGLLRPIIVLPESALEAYTATEMRLILTHELAHIRAGDLWWMAAAALTETIFFFHPLLWLAGREFALAREADCDRTVLRLSEAPAAVYGRVLVKIVTAKPKRDTFIATLGAAVGYRLLRTRLTLLQHSESHPPTKRMRTARALLTICLCALLFPWRITERSRAAQTAIRRPSQMYDVSALTLWLTTPRANGNGAEGGTTQIGETLSQSGQPQHYIMFENSLYESHTCRTQLYDSGLTAWRWWTKRRDGAVNWGPTHHDDQIVGAVPNLMARDSRRQARLRRTASGVELTAEFGLPLGADGATVLLQNAQPDLFPDRSSGQVSFHQAYMFRNNTKTFLGVLSGGSYSIATAYNDHSQVTGVADDRNGAEHAFLWENGVMRDLGPGSPLALNSGGQIVGYYRTADNATHACMWENGSRIDLGTLGGRDSKANSIDDAGVVVGDSTDATGTPRAFIYVDGRMTDLNRWTVVGSQRLLLTSAKYIQNNGQIIAYGTLPNAVPDATGEIKRQGFWLTPHLLNPLQR